MLEGGQPRAPECLQETQLTDGEGPQALSEAPPLHRRDVGVRNRREGGDAGGNILLTGRGATS